MAGERTLPGAGLKAGWTIGSNGYGADMENNFRLISAVMQGKAVSRTTALPGTPTLGDIYIVVSTDPTNPDKVAVYDTFVGGSPQWFYLTPKTGWSIYVADESAHLVWNGSAWRPEGYYDIATFVAGVMTATENVLRHVVARPFTIKSGATNVVASAGIASASNSALSLKKNGAAFGTMTFNVTTTGVYSQAADATFAVGDVITITGPAVADITLADIAITMKGRLA